MSRVTHVKESYHNDEWDMSQLWMSHVTHMNASCHTGRQPSRLDKECLRKLYEFHKQLKAYIAAEEVKLERFFSFALSSFFWWHIVEPCGIDPLCKKRVMSHMNESRHACKRRVMYKWVMSPMNMHVHFSYM